MENIDGSALDVPDGARLHGGRRDGAVRVVAVAPRAAHGGARRLLYAAAPVAAANAAGDAVASVVDIIVVAVAARRQRAKGGLRARKPFGAGALSLKTKNTLILNRYILPPPPPLMPSLSSLLLSFLLSSPPFVLNLSPSPLSISHLLPLSPLNPLILLISCSLFLTYKLSFPFSASLLLFFSPAPFSAFSFLWGFFCCF